MKTSSIALILIALSSVLLQSCMTNMSIPILKPAQITLPSNFEKIAVTHRHRPNKENQVRNIVEGILTGEGLEADLEAGISALNGLKDALLKTPRYVVVEPPGLDLRGTGTSVFPAPLAWDFVERVCKDNNADALLVLEVFDSNSAISYTTAERKVKNKEGVESTVIDHVVRMRTTVNSGWRIYDYRARTIADEFKGNNWLDFTASGPTPEAALLQLLNRREALRRTGFHAGSQYGYRIAPQWIRVTREYYTKGSPSLKRAGRLAKTGDWKGAGEIWEKYSASVNKKIGMRSMYNAAIAKEVNGDLDEALIWARKCYTQWGKRKALAYSNVLRARIIDRDRLEQQMK
jgi:hypothetical protein